jgi:hypothetical protein
MPAGAASRYALGAGGVGVVRPAPTASLISASRYARRSAHGAARRGRCAPVCRAAQPLAAIAASRYALGADGVGAARPGACGSPRAARSAPMAWALRARAPTRVPPPITRALPLGGCRCRRRRALCADREARCTRRFALLPSARVGRGVSDIIMHERGGERLRATAACAVRVGAARHCNRSALPPGQADPPHFERARGCTPLERGIMTRLMRRFERRVMTIP